MVTAAFTTTFATGAAHLTANNFDPVKAVDSLLSKNTLKSLAISMLTAGIMHKACEHFKLKPDTAKYDVVKGAVEASIKATIGGQDLDKVLLHTAVNSAISAAANSIADKNGASDAKKVAIQMVASGITEEIVGEHGAIIGAINGLVDELGRQAVEKQRLEKQREADAANLLKASKQGLHASLEQAFGNNYEHSVADKVISDKLQGITERFGQGDYAIGLQAYGDWIINHLVQERHNKNLERNIPSTLATTREVLLRELPIIIRQADGNVLAMDRLLRDGPNLEVIQTFALPAVPLMPMATVCLAMGIYAITLNTTRDYKQSGVSGSDTWSRLKQGLDTLTMPLAELMMKTIPMAFSPNHEVDGILQAGGYNEVPDMPTRTEYPAGDGEVAEHMKGPLVTPVVESGKSDHILTGPSPDTLPKRGEFSTPPYSAQQQSNEMLLMFRGGSGTKDSKNQVFYEKIEKMQLPVQSNSEIKFELDDADMKMRKLFFNHEQKGYVDKYKNVWKKGPSSSNHSSGEPWEWDVQLHPNGRKVFKKLYEEKFPHKNFDSLRHVNVTLTGKLIG